MYAGYNSDKKLFKKLGISWKAKQRLMAGSHDVCKLQFYLAAQQSVSQTVLHCFATGNVPMQGKNHIKANTRGVSASVVKNEASGQSRPL